VIKKFCRFELRTTDAKAARVFYASVLGHDRAVIWPLHEQALARGAKPHWVGFVGVNDVDHTFAELVERGATLLGPAPPTREGGRAGILRDPGGALFGVCEPLATHVESPVQVVWHVLNTNDVTRATTNYCDLFGWTLTERVHTGPAGSFQEFAWGPDGPSVGALADIAERPGVHPHWLFFHEVDALEPAMSATRANGGLALEPLTLPGGARACVCDDAQGAAFGLWERQARG
jgi:predicted enzyme related to lactoylglutathione lyase